ncbi:MAG: phage tail tube protein [Roseomonas mucosa]|nr:phage tail tube protein [Roseomonas mucosa]
MAQYLGIIDVIWRGRKIPMEKGAKFRLGGLKNNQVVTGRQVGRAQEWVPSTCEGTTTLNRGMKWADIWTADEGELQINCDTGQSYVSTDAFLEGDPPEITGGEGGKITLKWVMGECEEITNG